MFKVSHCIHIQNSNFTLGGPAQARGRRAEELLLKHEDDEVHSANRTIVLVENRHIHGVLTSTVVDTDSGDMMEMN